MTPDRTTILAAIKDLVNDKSPRFKLEALDAVTQVARRYPVELTGALAVLNPLVHMRLTDDEEWEATKTRIDVRREKEGLEPCWPPAKPPKFTDRYNEYQRELMQEIRARCRRASTIENLQRRPDDALRGNPRLEFERRTHLEWAKRRDAMLEAAREKWDGPMPRQARRELTDAFWAAVDMELDAMERRARQESVKPATKRSTGGPPR